MSVVDAIKNQAAGDVLARLSALAGESEERTAAATAAAAPAILAALANSVLDGEKLDALVDALRDFDGTDPAEDPTAASDVLETILGPNLPALVEVLARFSGLDVPAMRALVGRLGPIVLAAVAARLTGGGGLTPANVASFFTAEKPNVVRALPAGLSPADLSSPPAFASTLGAAGSDPFPWLLPALIVGLLALSGFFYMMIPPDHSAPASEPADAVPIPPPPLDGPPSP